MPKDSARLSIDVAPALRTRLKIAALQKGVSLREYCLEAIEERLDREEEAAEQSWARLSATTFARDWSSPEDSVYDSLS